MGKRKSGGARKIIRSPLIYPGGKARKSPEISSYFPRDLKETCAPFLGGGIEIQLAHLGVQAYASDIFEPLVNFWRVQKKQPKALAERARRYFPLHEGQFNDLKTAFAYVNDPLTRAVVFFVVNRASFSGLTFSVSESATHKQFTKNSIDYVETFRCENLHFQSLGYERALAKHPGKFAYLDPPYNFDGRLYGVNGELHTNFDHDRLAKVLRKRENWVMSYNNDAYIRELYKGLRIEEIDFWHTASGKIKRITDILIINR